MIPSNPTNFEQVAGSIATEAALTVIAALAGGPLAPLLPVLCKSIASERQRIRVEEYLIDVSSMLQKHEEQIQLLSDQQYKILNECILASLQTTQAAKLDMLRAAVKNSLSMENLLDQEAILLSRIIRDISVEEAEFVLHNFGYRFIYVTDSTPDSPEIKTISPESREALIVSGLISLGVLTIGEPTLGQLLRFSTISAKLITLVRK